MPHASLRCCLLCCLLLAAQPDAIVKVGEVVTNINGTFVIEEDKKNPKRFYIGDTSKLGLLLLLLSLAHGSWLMAHAAHAGEYKGGGIGTTVRQGKHLSFDSFKHNRVCPP